jgi:hypothetical protein
MYKKLIIRDGRIKFGLFYLILVSGLMVVEFAVPAKAKESLYEWNYFRNCLILGLALGVDVMCATIGRFRSLDTWSKRLMWCYRAAAGHTIFPLVGVVLCLTLASWFGTMSNVVGFAGFFLILFIYGSEVKETLQSGSDEKTTEEPREVPGFFQEIGRSEWALAAAVSLDSLLTGSTQGTQTIGWSAVQISCSFIFVGLIVGLLGAIAAGIAWLLQRTAERFGGKSVRLLANIQLYGLFLEIAVIGYFGWNALINFGLNWEFEWTTVVLISFLATTVFFLLLGRKLSARLLAEAQEAVRV